MLDITIGDSICAKIVSKLFDFCMYLHSFSWCSYGYARFTHAVCFVFQLDCLNFPCACLDFLWFSLVLFHVSWYIFHHFLCLEPSECHRNPDKAFFNNQDNKMGNQEKHNKKNENRIILILFTPTPLPVFFSDFFSDFPRKICVSKSSPSVRRGRSG